MRAAWRKTTSLGILLATAWAASTAVGQDRFRVPLLEDWEDPVARQDNGDRSAADGGNVEAATFYQPPAGQPGGLPPQPAARRGTTGARQSGVRLASVPNMFGDLPTAIAGLQIINSVGQVQAFKNSFDVPLSGGGRVGKIAENDTPIPVDRVFFNYNHFQNVFEISEQSAFPPGPALIRQEPIDRYTIGVEKTFFDGSTSVELRMPFLGTFDTQLQTVGVSGGNVGNLTVVAKSLLYFGDNLAVGAGLAIETPTGSDTVARVGIADLRFRNQATHMLPYIGFLLNPGDPRWGWGEGLFVTGFAQMDIAASSNRVDVIIPDAGPQSSLGNLTEQNLLFFDIAVGYWLYRNPDAERLTGIAAVGEVHYTTSVQDADFLTGTIPGGGVAIGGPGNSIDVVNGTIGVQCLLFDLSSLRVAGVFPMGNENHRLFDSEVQVQFNRRF